MTRSFEFMARCFVTASDCSLPLKTLRIVSRTNFVRALKFLVRSHHSIWSSELPMKCREVLDVQPSSDLLMLPDLCKGVNRYSLTSGGRGACG